MGLTSDRSESLGDDGGSSKVDGRTSWVWTVIRFALYFVAVQFGFGLSFAAAAVVFAKLGDGSADGMATLFVAVLCTCGFLYVVWRIEMTIRARVAAHQTRSETR